MADLVSPATFPVPAPGEHVPPTVVTAKKLAQSLLWSTIAVNTETILRRIFHGFIERVPFRARHQLVRDSGMIQAVLITVKAFQDDTGVLTSALDCLEGIIPLGDLHDSIDSVLEVEEVYDILQIFLRSSDPHVLRKVFTLLDLMFRCRICRELISWHRLIPQMIGGLEKHEDCCSLLVCYELLHEMSAHEEYVVHMLQSGGLLVLYNAYQKHHHEPADAALRHILSLDLTLPQPNPTLPTSS